MGMWGRARLNDDRFQSTHIAPCIGTSQSGATPRASRRQWSRLPPGLSDFPTRVGRRHLTGPILSGINPRISRWIAGPRDNCQQPMGAEARTRTRFQGIRWEWLVPGADGPGVYLQNKEAAAIENKSSDLILAGTAQFRPFRPKRRAAANICHRKRPIEIGRNMVHQ